MGALGVAIPQTPVISSCFTILSIRSLETFSHLSSAVIITPCVRRETSLLSSHGPSFPTLPSPSSALVNTGLFSAFLKSTLKLLCLNDGMWFFSSSAWFTSYGESC